MPDFLHSYISMGSNSPNADAMLSGALDAICGIHGIAVSGLSPVYATEPQGYRQQPWFKNQVIDVVPSGSWTPEKLLAKLLGIETSLGRTRSHDPALRFGPRVIDLDILLFGSARSDSSQCCLPHPRLLQRAFVLVPLLDIAPELCIDGTSLRESLGRLQYRREGYKIYQ